MQKKSLKVVLIVASAFLLSSVPIFAQTAQASASDSAGPIAATDTDIELLREDIRSERKRLVAANLSLTDTEATKFWPLYDQYLAEVSKIGDVRLALIKEYLQSFDTITDAQANDLLKSSAAIDQQFPALLAKYVPIFEKVISPKKTVQWYQIDRRLDLLINVELAANIPLVRARQ
jgi:Spy/CpxP family protein refolding chaperone